MAHFPSKQNLRGSGHPLMSLGRYLSCRRVARRWQIVLAGVWVAGLIAVDRGGYLLDQGDDWGRYEGKAFHVTRVIDGDTLEIAVPDGAQPVTRVRFWGIDTPELAKRDTHRPAEPFADEAAAYVRGLCRGQKVRLSLEPHRLRGRYGRLLAFVALPDGTVLNEQLLAVGLARADGRFSHRWMGRYELIQQRAQNEALGLWKSRAVEPTPLREASMR